MIKFFRKIRHNLMETRKTTKYFKYAIGEIILVVIGILIALQINNWNEERKNRNREQSILKNLQIDFKLGSEMILLLDEKDISLKIRNQEVTSYVSVVSALKEVREMMVSIQRSTTRQGNFIVEGRDIGSIVFPDAKYKFYLIADYDIRAKRRLADFEKINEAKNINKIKKDLIVRDKYDSTRKLSPLIKPDGAIIIDTSECTIKEQVNQILKHIER